ncbi:hypothetical protein OAP18_00405 [Gammaproteobacteria bacterium]|nr:hypothetical protein [Gammaproteobacteria bacterium]
MQTIKLFLISLVSITSLFILTSCTVQPEIVGLWQSTDDFGSIEFKANGEAIVMDNMSATVVGRYEIEDDLVKFELNATDIMRESIETVPTVVVTATLISLEGDDLQLYFEGEDRIESFKRAL